jgi:hypothetical protein
LLHKNGPVKAWARSAWPKVRPRAAVNQDIPHWALIQETVMDVMGIAKLATSIADTGTRQEVAIAVL